MENLLVSVQSVVNLTSWLAVRAFGHLLLGLMLHTNGFWCRVSDSGGFKEASWTPPPHPINGALLWMLLHNVWCMRELLKEMAVVKGKHCDKNGFGVLNPREYFDKVDEEKLRIIKKIIGL